MTNFRGVFLSAAVAGTIVSGGCTASGPVHEAKTPSVQIIDLGSAGYPVWRSAGAVTGDLAVVWGGLTGAGKNPSPVARGWILPTGGGSAIATTASPIGARSGHIAVSHSGRVLFWGGVDAAGQHLKDGAILDPQANTWQKMPDAPFGLESPKAIALGDYLLIGAGRREGNNFNTTFLEYHLPSAAWRVLNTDVSDVVTWALVGDSIVTVSRQPNGADLTLHWLDRDGQPTGKTTSLDTSLQKAAYLGITANGENAVVAASTREKTELFRTSNTGAPLRHDKLDGAVFSPAMNTASGTAADSMERQGDTWFSFMEWEVQSLSINDAAGRGSWHLPTCRSESAWIDLGNKRFLRYGGIACGGDVPPDDGAPMQLVELS